MPGETRRQFLRQVGGAAAAAGLALAPAPGAAGPVPAPGAAETAAPPARPPNVLFFFPDQHRHDWTAADPAVAVRTPNLERLAARGVRLARALTPSPLCAPARACLAAGKEYDRCRVPGNGTDYPLDQMTVYTLLQRAGYHTMGCGKFDLHKASPIWGTDGRGRLAEWGFSDGVDSAGKWDAIATGAKEPKDPYMAFLRDRGLLAAHVEDMQKRRGNRLAAFPTTLPEEAYGDNWVAANGLALLDRAPRDRPWLLQVNFPGPHDPWDITARMDRACRDLARFPPPVGSDALSPEHLAVRQNYAAMVENLDRWLGVYLDRLQDRGDLDRTLVVWSSDHGEMLGDHGAWGKSKPWQPSVGVPLVLAGPGVRPGGVHDGPATVLDLAATFLDCAGAAVPADMDSRSLRPLLEGRTDRHRGHVLSGLGAWRLVYDGRFKLVTGWARGADARPRGEAAGGRRAAEKPVLFDLQEDPGETTDASDARPADVARLQALLGPRGA